MPITRTGPQLSDEQRRLAVENIARCKAYKAQKEKPPIEGIRLEGHLHFLKPEPLGASLLDLTNSEPNLDGSQSRRTLSVRRVN